jgi:hypothetical protein
VYGIGEKRQRVEARGGSKRWKEGVKRKGGRKEKKEVEKGMEGQDRRKEWNEVLHKKTAAPDIGIYFRVENINTILCVGLLMGFIFILKSLRILLRLLLSKTLVISADFMLGVSMINMLIPVLKAVIEIYILIH